MCSILNQKEALFNIDLGRIFNNKKNDNSNNKGKQNFITSFVVYLMTLKILSISKNYYSSKCNNKKYSKEELPV
jgi:hypothetical protein|tara:strand:- start:3485 stop:3706 length:222 start_codon:yes stop_codon:yes gene_type:complete